MPQTKSNKVHARRTALSGRSGGVVRWASSTERKRISGGLPEADPATAATRVLILTTIDLDEHVFAAIRAGASGFLLKDTDSEDLLAAIRIVAGGEALVAPTVTRRLIEAFVRQSPTEPARTADLDVLTEREIEALRSLAHGRSNAEIAADLFISYATTKTHVSHLLTKLGARDRAQLDL
ncbi:response regulator transcription factor [Cryobacterium cheniae]|uniref:Response regulator transcription factor n=1 Tax=Cryobacterium cheniae TaxID=1259262 RepID=A0A4R8XT61_9MICO|nr:response regulator transcription factor [Cryobacterium cheniae]